jgi:hypothetical protein
MHLENSRLDKTTTLSAASLRLDSFLKNFSIFNNHLTFKPLLPGDRQQIPRTSQCRTVVRLHWTLN